MDLQKHLIYLTNLELQKVFFSNLRGITAVWKNPTAYIAFYFDGEASEQELEDASDVCTYIIAHFPDGLLEERYIRWDSPKPLPNENFVVYKPKDEK